MKKIAIHKRENSFSDRWIEYCDTHGIEYVIVNCYDSNIINIIKSENVTHLMWHFHHSSFLDIQISSYVFNSAELMGIKTFPNRATRWHFDDKVAQKYLFESLNLPHVESFVFYSKLDAKRFVKKCSYPLVYKLRRGAGSANVKLVQNEADSQKHIELMFNTGVNSSANPLKNFDQKVRVARKVRNPFFVLKKTYNYLKKSRREKALGNREKGYVYFQKFMPNNDFDTRIIVVGQVAFGIRRFNKDNDFRASGSGKISYDTDKIDLRCVESAFEATKRIGAQCLAYDFVYDQNNVPKIIEICYAFSMKAYDQCEGYWDRDLNFHRTEFNPQYLMIENLLAE